jgi:hypothetical protein
VYACSRIVFNSFSHEISLINFLDGLIFKNDKNGISFGFKTRQKVLFRLRAIGSPVLLEY